MACWPATVAGAFSFALLFLDLYMDNWDDLPNHALYGVVFTGIFLVLCNFVSESVSGAVLVVPALLLVVFGITVWFVGASIRKRGCCLNCSPQPEPNPCPGPAPSPICTNPLELKGKPLFL
jgi:hypothetical protein